MTKILVTNNTGGNHEPEKWAMATAEMIADISQLNGGKLLDGQALQLKMAQVLERYHAIVQDTERQALLNDPQHADTPLKLPLDIKVVIDDLVAATVSTPWETEFQQADIQDSLTGLVGNHLMSSMHVERVIHNDKLNQYRGAI